MIVEALKATILVHHGAELRGTKWVCVCGLDLELPAESVLHPSAKEITDAWAAHLAQRIAHPRGKR
jgi:hypothetical protein